MIRQITLVVLTLLALAACGAPRAAAPSVPTPGGPRTIAPESRLLDSAEAALAPQAGETAPDFEYRLADGTALRLSELRGKKVLINFWATWCDPCREEMHDLQRVQDERGDSLVVLGVNKVERAEVIPPFADEFGITFPLIANTDGDISDRYAAKNIPTTYFINSDGTIDFRKIGVMDYSFIVSRLDQMR